MAVVDAGWKDGGDGGRIYGAIARWLLVLNGGECLHRHLVLDLQQVVTAKFDNAFIMDSSLRAC